MKPSKTMMAGKEATIVRIIFAEPCEPVKQIDTWAQADSTPIEEIMTQIGRGLAWGERIVRTIATRLWQAITAPCWHQ